MLIAHVTAAALLFLQQGAEQQQQGSSLPPSPVVRIEITPRARTVVAGDSVRFEARALDAAGRQVPNARILFAARGGGGEGSIDSTGLVIAASVGKMPISVTAVVPGTRPVIEPLDLRLLPGRAARIELRTTPRKLVVGQQVYLNAIPLARSSDRSLDSVRWSSSAPAVARTSAGMLTALAPGRAAVTATAGDARASFNVDVVANTIASLAITPSTPEVRQGDVVKLGISARDRAGRQVTELSPSWSLSPGNGQLDADGNFVGYRAGNYIVTASLGNRTATTVVRVVERDVRRPVTVVGRLPRTEFPTAEVWIHPNGRVAYLGTHGGGDRVYAIDISNPASPVVVDSIQANTRLVNDMMTTPDGDYMVFTREGAADRKNGIVIADTRDPLHPKEIAHFTEGVTAGVHSAYVYRQEKYGTHVYLTNDGTGALHVIDISDPRNPKEVAQWRTARLDVARYVHDIDLHDGLLYASYWNDGLVILDVGNGVKGGSPSNPQLVSQFKYNLDSLYRDVEVVSGPGFTRGTHTAWRQRDGKYVFIADEVYRASPVAGAKDASANRMYGTLQVVDVSDLEHPRSVAWYTPESGGVHNVWVVADTLYMGAYDAGFHVFDISGELRGDLLAQGREIASLNTADMTGNVPNAASTWGVVVNPKDGLAYVNDFNNGLWVVRVEPKGDLKP
ncbi:MAG: Ig-like domain-containing protein [Gemmatimonadaceae bacterium]